MSATLPPAAPAAPAPPAADRRPAILVVGAGPLGIALAKAMRAHGLAYEHVEADDDVGGNWYHGVYETAHVISSKRVTAYADHPMPADYPDYPSAAQMLAYLRDYASRSGVREHVQFRTTLVMARPLGDGSAWACEVEVGQGAGARRERRVYKGVALCTGHHWDPRLPSYPGTFTGEFIHSKQYKRPDQLSGRRVLVIGGGNSACDVASEAARVGAASDIALRRGYWFLPKFLLGRALTDLLPVHTPAWVQRPLLRAMLRVAVGRYEQYGLPRPDHRLFAHHPTINGELLHYLKHGRVRARPDVARFDGRRVEFTDGTSGEYDLVVAATGYHLSFPCLPPGLVPVKGNIAQVYGGMLLPDYKNLYVIGWEQARSGFGGLVTPGMDLAARMMTLQAGMELPLGLVLKESGDRIPGTHLADPGAMLRRMWLARRMLPRLARKERRLRAKFTGRRGLRPVAEPAVTGSASGAPPLRVF